MAIDKLPIDYFKDGITPLNASTLNVLVDKINSLIDAQEGGYPSWAEIHDAIWFPNTASEFQSSGTAAKNCYSLNTGINNSPTTKWEITMQIKDWIGDNPCCVGGSAPNATAGRFGCIWYPPTSTTTPNTTNLALDEVYSCNDAPDFSKHIYVIDGNTASLSKDGATLVSGAYRKTGTNYIYLCGRSQGTNDGRFVTLQGNIYVFRSKIWENGELIQDLIPCRLKESTSQTIDGQTYGAGVVGMYDLVTEIFYPPFTTSKNPKVCDYSGNNLVEA